jgi:hypothetical protein
MKAALAVVMLLSAAPACAQNESAVHAEFGKEAKEIKKSCGSGGIKGVGSCAIVLATAQPVHVAFGSLAPQSGFAFGAALVGHHNTPKTWRINWNGDAVATPGGSWRGGAYAKFVRTSVARPGVTTGPSVAPSANDTGEYPVYSVYTQAISLDTLLFFGLGPATPVKSAWGLSETIAGGSALVPVRSGGLGLAVIGGATSRFVRVRGKAGDSIPSIETRYTSASAPGLHDDTHFIEFTEGVRLVPSWFGAHVRPNYLFTADQFVAPAGAKASFTRWTVDVRHDFPLYKTRRPAALDSNGPDDCLPSPTATSCPAVSHDRNGTFSVRFLTIASTARAGSAVPFYLQPTLGGSDINGNTLLGSFEDYRFRAPNALALQATFEHSLWEPLGFILMAEHGKAALDRADLFKNAVHSYAAGLTLRAGGFPQISFLFSWSHERHHIGATMSSTLLGGSARPSLY